MIRKSAAAAARTIGISTPLVGDNDRIGIMGGSFNPPHQGHVIVARTALRRLRLDRIWWLVTPGNPLKSHGDLAPLDERIAGIRALTDDPKMQITAFEEDLNTPYTAATLAFLKTRYSKTKFVWVMGADNLASFHRWQRWQDIAATMPFAVVDRPAWHLRGLASPAARMLAGSRIDESLAGTLPDLDPPAWSLLTTRLSPLSSSAIRANRP